MKLTLILLLITQVTFAQVPISQARNLRVGKSVVVTGNVTATFGKLSFVQDKTGGIAIYDADVSLNDSILLNGKLSRYNGMLEIVADSVSILGKDRRTDPTKLLIGNIHEHEGELVQIINISLTPQNTFFYPQRGGFIRQENDSIQYWIDEDTDIPGYSIPGSTNLTGVVGRYENIIQVLPRSHLDISNTTTEAPKPSEFFTIMNWNVEFFGAKRYGPSNDELQISNVVKLLSAFEPDIVALQEVSNESAFESLLEKIKNYAGLCSNRYSFSFNADTDFPPQKVCFVYKTSSAKAATEKILFGKLFDEYPSDMFSSGRLPYLIEFDVHERRLSVVNVHAKSGATENDFNRRLSDSKLLKDSLDRYTDIVLLGDLNDDVSRSIVSGHESPYLNFIDDPNYLCVSRSFNNMIDHQIISSSLVGSHLTTKVVNAFSVIDRYYRTTSDHLPVISEFDFSRIITSAGSQPDPVVYPNPTHDQIWFPTDSNITVLNSMGEVVIKEKGARPPISLGEHAPGLYLVVLEDQVFRVIKF